jgi:hypothetical protein
VGTQISVWNTNAVSLDEITRAHPSVVSKLMELVRTKRVYGLPTSIELVFATANPPSRDYIAHKLDLAVASRFVIVEVPAFHELSTEDARTVLSGSTLQGTWPWFSYPEVHGDTDLVMTLNALLMQHGVRLSGRQAKALQSLLACSLVAAEHGCARTPRTLARLVLACIPEASGLCTAQVDRNQVMMAVETFFEQRMLLELPPASDWPAYFAALTSRIQACASPLDAQLLLDQIPVLRSTTGRDEDIQRLLVGMVPAVLRYPPSHLSLKALPDLLRDIFAC